jgi:hypothetical protein
MKLTLDEVRMAFIFPLEEPFPEDHLLENLKGRGFVEITEVPKRIGTEAFGIERLDIVKKGGCKVAYDDKAGIISVVGRVPLEVLKTFEEVGKTLEDMGYNLLTDMRTFELHIKGRFFVKDKAKPLESIANFLGLDKLSKFKDVVGEEVAPFCVRFYPKDKMRSAENLRRTAKWFDLNFYPYVPNPQYFGIDAVFRNPDLVAIKDMLEKIEERTLKIIEIITSG